MLMRNLNKSAGLVNGRKVRVLQVQRHALIVRLLETDEVHVIPRITLIIDLKHGIKFHRKQFPVTLAYCITISKSIGKTFAQHAMDLRNPVFMHGMFYLASSRTNSMGQMLVLSTEQQYDCDQQGFKTQNIVDHRFLQCLYSDTIGLKY